MHLEKNTVKGMKGKKVEMKTEDGNKKSLSASVEMPSLEKNAQVAEDGFLTFHVSNNMRC